LGEGEFFPAGPVKLDGLNPLAPFCRQLARPGRHRPDLSARFIVHGDHVGLAQLGLLDQVAELIKGSEMHIDAFEG